MGHEVYVVSHSKNEFTWFPLDGPEYVVAKHQLNYPDADANIATGFNSARTVAIAPASKGIKFHWIRAHETWITKNPREIYDFPTIKWVNSECLKYFLKREYGIDTDILYPGIDLDVFTNKNPNRYKSSVFAVGALYNTKARKRFEWIRKIAVALRHRFEYVPFYLFGTDSKPATLGSHFKYLEQPTPSALRNLYNVLSIWLAPTNSEGLHICPMEAALCGCVVVATNAELAGMRDWLVDGLSGFESADDYRSYESKVFEAVKFLHSDKVKDMVVSARNIIENIIGSRERNMRRMVELIEERL